MMLIQRFFAGIDTFGLMALPFFILAANLMDTGGLSRRIFKIQSRKIQRRLYHPASG